MMRNYRSRFHAVTFNKTIIKISFSKSIAFIFFFCLLRFNSHSQILADAAFEKSVDSLVATQFKQNEPGVSILIAKHGQIVYEKAFGSANVELNVAMQPDMIFRIGSITKQFTAIGILQLVEQGKISLQDSIQKYIKDFPTKGYTITIENLLTHTSGIPDYSNGDTTHNSYIERHDFTPQQIIKYFDYLPLEFKPGTKYNYSNSGYVLLAYIIEKVTGESYHNYMEESVIKTAGLTNTLYAKENVIVPKRVEGYTRDKGFYENREYQSIAIGYGCGDLMSTTEDLYKWNNALLAYKLVKKEMLEKAFTPYKLSDGSFTNYGYGWFIDNTLGSKCIHHEGQVSGFISLERYFPFENIYVTILTNVQSGEDTTDFSDKRFRLFDKIFSLSLGNKLPIEVAVSDLLLESYVGTYRADSIYNADGTVTKYIGKEQLITIREENKKLFANLSNGTGKNMFLMPQTETLFFLTDVERIKTTIEFIIEKGKPVGIYWTQEHKSEWKKIL